MKNASQTCYTIEFFLTFEDEIANGRPNRFIKLKRLVHCCNLLVQCEVRRVMGDVASHRLRCASLSVQHTAIGGEWR